MNKTIEELKAVLAAENISENEPMKNHTSFKVGGPADLFLRPQSKEELEKVLKICKASGKPFYVMGNGSNLIVRDGGYSGIIINTKALNLVKVEGETLIAEPGISLKDLANIALEEKLTGIEFASGIPGSLGGAVTMNAGAYDGEMKKIITSIQVITEDGTIKTIPQAACAFGYRSSVLQANNWVLSSVEIQLKHGNYQEIKDKMLDLNTQRATKQPLEYPSAGSTFRRPEGYYAGKLVQDAGFRGHRVGGAQVSEKHSGFVINRDGATAADILNLIGAIQAGVSSQFGVELKTEVIVIGQD
ncbi:UDP-N-acetylmuramate dehydrogenase [Acetobacterium woodii]|uniref:UDP-N-acetylenolpyruvoylglucosamine reductase n=1 Tax=Acetobacterium woodii (strain ATCC 29683 / DSM 1030 / JCM 2381 / KCTC 1655 / WB1) TaxID=931626 RepID=H6LFF9_ACEWD|nr:UDP-N-acetylmuramate dehydrogenase [Acetobacterium woodii]AFA49446.1 UDP-N-acetylenolpyruvoylglucosamine reductase MurB [Acetobacterium woodii DSM 1030]